MKKVLNRIVTLGVFDFFQGVFNYLNLKENN